MIYAYPQNICVLIGYITFTFTDETTIGFTSSSNKVLTPLNLLSQRGLVGMRYKHQLQCNVHSIKKLVQNIHGHRFQLDLSAKNNKLWIMRRYEVM